MISVHNLKKSFGNVQVLKGINIEIRKGECVCIIGPSGSGKSTFLMVLKSFLKISFNPHVRSACQIGQFHPEK